MFQLIRFMFNALLLHPIFLQFRLVGRLLFVILWLFLGIPPAVRAFLPTLVHRSTHPVSSTSLRMQGPSFVTPPFTVSSSFMFPTVPLRDAIQYIHTPEYLQSILHLAPPNYFQIQRVSPPIRYGEFATVSMSCLIRSVPHHVVMLSRPDQNHSCTYMCFHDGMRLGEVHLRARPNDRFPSDRGHVLAIDTTYFSRSKRLVDSYLDPTLGFISKFENASRADRNDFKPHPNLQWYRRMVLGLPNMPDRWL